MRSKYDPYLEIPRRIFWSLTIIGGLFMLLSLADVLDLGWSACVGMFFLGLGLVLSAGGTLAISYGILAEDDIVPIRILIRCGFICGGFGGALMEQFTPPACLIGGIIVLAAIGSLLLLLYRHRKGK